MGNGQGQLNVPKMSSYLRQSMSRISIHRSKKLTAIAKKKDDIAKHLESGNEVNAKIWAETLINDEGMVPCYDIVSILCDQLNGRLKTIEKFGPPKDMDQAFRTIAYSASRMEIDELAHVRRYLGKLLGKEFLISADTDEAAVNKVIAANINIRIPEEGEKIKRLVEIAKERNIDYRPSAEALQSLRDYCDRKGIENPVTGQKGAVVDSMMPPPYNPAEGFSHPPAGVVDYSQPPIIPTAQNTSPFMPPPPINVAYAPMYPGIVYQPQVPPQMPPPPQAYQYSLFDPTGAQRPNVTPSPDPQNINPPFYQPQGGQQPGASDVDDFQAKLDALKKL